MDNLDTWRKAGRIAAEALEYGRKLIKNGAVILEVCDKIDAKIVQLGAKPAWPTQVGIDSVAAHWTPNYDDTTVFDNNLVCLDVGAHIDGCVGDNATSVDLCGKYQHLLDASEEALEAAIKLVKKGVALGDIGRTIQETITSHGAIPVKNLCGHGIAPWIIHDKPSVPNYDTKDKRTLVGDQIIAIEPFSTNGVGMIVEGEQANLFSLVASKPIRSPFAREVLKHIETEYKALPFTTRWLITQFGVGKTNLAMNELLRAGLLHPYPPLVEKNKGMVAVFEKTLYVGEKVEILTKN